MDGMLLRSAVVFVGKITPFKATVLPKRAPPIDLTPEQEFYLKKALVRRQLETEFQWLQQQPDATSLSISSLEDNTLYISYLVNNVLLEFPMVKEQDDDFWTNLTGLFAKTNSIRSNNAFERDATTSHSEKSIRKIYSLCKWIMTNAIKTKQQKHLSAEFQQLLTNPLADVKQSALKEAASASASGQKSASGSEEEATLGSVSKLKNAGRLYARVLFVRDILVDGKVTNGYVIRSQIGDDVFIVEHRFHEFQELQSKLTKEFKDEVVPDAPMGGVFKSKSKKKLMQNVNAFLYTLLSNEKFRRSVYVKEFLMSEKYKPKLFESEQEIVTKFEKARREQDQKTKELEAKISKRIAELYKDAYAAFDELTHIHGFAVFINLLKSTNNISELPVHYQSVFELIRLQLGYYIFRRFHASLDADEGIKSIKRIYKVMPFGALGVLAGLASSQAIIKMSIDILLAKPFGAPNLLQRIAMMGLEKENPEQRIKDLEATINDSQLCTKLKNYVYRAQKSGVTNNSSTSASKPTTNGSTEFKNSLEWIKSVLLDETFEPKIDADLVATLTSEQLGDLYSYLAMHVVLRDNKKLVELFGDSDFVSMIKKLLPKLTFIIIEFNQSVNMRRLTTGIKHFMRDLINVASINNPNLDPNEIAALQQAKSPDFGVPQSPFPLQRAASEDQCLEQFLDLIKNIETNVFAFLKDLFSRDDSIPQIRKLLVWIFFVFNFMRQGNVSAPVDVCDLVSAYLMPPEREQLIKELKDYEEYETKKRQLLRKRMEKKLKKLAKIARSTAEEMDSSIDIDDDDDYYVQRAGLKLPQTPVIDKLSRPFALAVVQCFQQSFTKR